MRLTTSIGWNRPWLRQMVRFCCKQLDYPNERLNSATFTRCHNSRYRGKVFLQTRVIRVKINPLNHYPFSDHVPKSLPPVLVADPIELVVLITAHEVAHLERWDRFARKLRFEGKRDTFLEADTERHARRVLEAFRERRPSVLESWDEDPGPGPVPPAFVHRLTCQTCGWSRETANRPSAATRRSCQTCFPTWEAAAAAGQFLTFERVLTTSEAGR